MGEDVDIVGLKSWVFIFHFVHKELGSALRNRSHLCFDSRQKGFMFFWFKFFTMLRPYLFCFLLFWRRLFIIFWLKPVVKWLSLTLFLFFFFYALLLFFFKSFFLFGLFFKLFCTLFGLFFFFLCLSLSLFLKFLLPFFFLLFPFFLFFLELFLPLKFFLFYSLLFFFLLFQQSVLLNLFFRSSFLFGSFWSIIPIFSFMSWSCIVFFLIHFPYFNRSGFQFFLFVDHFFRIPKRFKFWVIKTELFFKKINIIFENGRSLGDIFIGFLNTSFELPPAFDVVFKFFTLFDVCFDLSEVIICCQRVKCFLINFKQWSSFALVDSIVHYFNSFLDHLFNF